MTCALLMSFSEYVELCCDDLGVCILPWNAGRWFGLGVKGSSHQKPSQRANGSSKLVANGILRCHRIVRAYIEIGMGYAS